MNRKQLIKKYIGFFKEKEHEEIKNSSLIPENDPTVLFTTAGMHPIVPFLLGQKHPQGKRLCNVQRCIRTGDIDEVGDTCHHTFFEMLGNWSLGDYWKKQAIEYTFEFLTEVLKIPVEKLAVTCFVGDENAPKDTETADAWISLEIPEARIAFLKEEDNWWGPAGKTGPCGPCTEQFFWTADLPIPEKFDPNDKRWVEIGNDVLMEYNKNEKGEYLIASQKNIDFGGGVERTIASLSGLDDNYLADMWLSIIKEIEKISKKKYENQKIPDGNFGMLENTKGFRQEEDKRAMRIIADHIKASVFIIADGIVPSNTEQGYVLRRLIRRAVRYGRFLGIENFTKKIAEPVFKIYDDYEILKKNKKKILEELEKEENNFLRTLEQGLRQAEKIFNTKTPINKDKFASLMKSPNKADLIGRIFDKKRQGKPYYLKDPPLSEKEMDGATITGEESFLLYQSYGFPLEMIDELAMAKGLLLSHKDFSIEQEKHQQLSRTATEGKFKSGLADNSEIVTRMHTATHLLNEALRQVLKDKNIMQRGSNITPERLRFDFNFPRKLTEEEIKKVESLVNEIINKGVEVKREEMTVEQAKKSGAIGIFESKYGEKVSVYSIGNFSKEICAGPHVKNTKEIGHLKIQKEESSAAGIRRIKAVLE